MSLVCRSRAARSLRPDRVLFAATKYVSNNLGPQYVDPPAFDLRGVFELSTPTIPLVFVLSPGVDPTKEVQALADQLGYRLDSCALGQVSERCPEGGALTLAVELSRLLPPLTRCQLLYALMLSSWTFLSSRWSCSRLFWNGEGVGGGGSLGHND